MGTPIETTISKARKLLRVGMKVETNANSNGTHHKIISGTIFCIHKEDFFILAEQGWVYTCGCWKDECRKKNKHKP